MLLHGEILYTINYTDFRTPEDRVVQAKGYLERGLPDRPYTVNEHTELCNIGHINWNFVKGFP